MLSLHLSVNLLVHALFTYRRAKALAADHSTLASNGDYLLKSLHAFVVDRYFPSIDRRIQQQLDAAFASETAFSLSWARYVSDQLGPVN